MSTVRHRSRLNGTTSIQETAASQTFASVAKTAGDPAFSWADDLALAIEYRPVDDLKPSSRNARTHSKKQIEKIAASIRQFGFTNPILIDGNGEVVAGHGRLEAAKSLGQRTVPTIRLDHLSESHIRAYRIADNRLAELSGWDKDLLKLELGALLELDVSFDVEITGFEMGEIDLFLDGNDDGSSADPDDEVEMPEGPAATRLGDLWLLGEHRLLCADAREKASYEHLLAGQLAQMIFTDPPFNLPVCGHVSGLGRVRHREFAMASGEMSETEFTAFLQQVLGNLATASVDGAIAFVAMDWRHMREVLTAGYRVYTELKNLCVWNKDNGGMGSFYRSKHELIFVFKNGKAPHINNFGLGEKGRWRANVWDYRGVNTLRRGRDEELAMHPTVKPVALVADAIRDCSKRKGIILDAFGGSGTTLIAAHRTGRRGYLLELDPIYCDVAVRRWQKMTGEVARHAASGRAFDEVARHAAEEAAPEGAEPRHG